MSIGKSKKILGKSTFDRIKARMAVLSQLTGKSGNQLGLAAGLGNATVNDWSDNHIENPTRAVEDFLKYHLINEVWWKTGEGEVFITQAQKPADNKEKMDKEVAQDLRDLIEKNDRYRLIPTVILTEYEILSKREQSQREQLLQQMLKQAQEISATKQVIIDSQDKLIADYENEIEVLENKIAELQKSSTPVPVPTK